MIDVQKIINYFSNYDPLGDSSNSVDTMLEYELLGAYLNGSLYAENSSYVKLSKDNKQIINNLYENAKYL